MAGFHFTQYSERECGSLHLHADRCWTVVDDGTPSGAFAALGKKDLSQPSEGDQIFVQLDEVSRLHLLKNGHYARQSGR